MKWVAAMGRKGGVGKTTAALSLAAHWARKGRQVLLIDLDPQGSLTLAAGATPDGAALADAIAGHGAAPEPVQTGLAGLTILPGGAELEGVTPARTLRGLVADAAADLVVVDCPPGHATLDRLAADAADVALVCCEAHRLAVAGAARVIEELRRRQPPPAIAIVLGRMDDRRGLDKTAPDLLAGAFGVPVWKMRQDALLAMAMNAGAMPLSLGRAAEDAAWIAGWVESVKVNLRK